MKRNITIVYSLSIVFISEKGNMLCTIARDITERKKIGERYRNLLRSVSDIIRETDDNLVFTFITPRVYESLGRTPEEGPGITKSSGRM